MKEKTPQKGGMTMEKLDTRAYLDEVCRLLEAGTHLVPVPVSGGSMCPILRPGDTVYLERMDTPPKKGDVVLFQRPDGAYVLHRIVGFTGDGRLWLLGDAQTCREMVDASWLRGRVVRVRRGDQVLGPENRRWQGMQHIWMALRPLRRWILQIRNKLA